MTAKLSADLKALALRLVAWHEIGPEDGAKFPGPTPASQSEREALRREGADWPLRADTMIGLKRLEQFGQAVAQCVADGIPGDIIETGVWRGGACIFASAVLRDLGAADRTVWVADSFAGLPPPKPELFPADRGDMHWSEDFLRVDQATVQGNFARHGLLDQQVKFLPGWFQDTLHAAPIDRLSVLRLDGDMYESTWVALEALYDRVSPGGFVIVDDYGAVDGCRRAIDDFRALRGIAAPIEAIDWTGRFWRVPLPAEHGLDIWPGELSPEAQAQLDLARSLAGQDRTAAEVAALAALALERNVLPAHLLLAELRLPGPDYRHHLAMLHEILAPRRYVEIGVGPGDSLALAQPDTRVIAVDPAPRVEQAIQCRELTLRRVYSDAFFADPDTPRLIGQDGFDLAFIDGSHLFEQVVDDFLNLEAHAGPNAVIVLHDTLPLDEATSSRERATTFWSGDVWRALAVLQRLRPDLEIDTIAAAPTGLTLVRNLSPRALVSEAAKAAAIAEMRQTDFAAYLAEIRPRLRIVPSEADSVRGLLQPWLRQEFIHRFANLQQWQSWTRANPWVFDAGHIGQMMRHGLLKGIVPPGSAQPFLPKLLGANLREQLMADGINARERAVLLVLDRVLKLPGESALAVIGPHALGPALALRFPGFDAQSDSADLVISLEQFHTTADLDRTLRAAAENGALVATFPFDWHGIADTMLADIGPDLSLIPNQAGAYRLPGWNILRSCRRAGFRQAEMLLVGSARHGVLESVMAGIFVLAARR